MVIIKIDLLAFLSSIIDVLLNLLIGQDILWKQSLEITQKLLVFERRIIAYFGETVRGIEGVLSDGHLVINKLDRWNRKLRKLFFDQLLVFFQGFVFLKIKKLAEVREVIHRLLELHGSVVIKTRVPELE